MVGFLEFVLGFFLLVVCTAFIRLAIYIYNIWIYKPEPDPNSRRRVGSDYLENSTSEIRNSMPETCNPRIESVPIQSIAYVQIHQENEMQNQNHRTKYSKRFSNASVRFPCRSDSFPSPSAPPYSYEAEQDLPPPYEEACAIQSSKI